MAALLHAGHPGVGVSLRPNNDFRISINGVLRFAPRLSEDNWSYHGAP
jgi:hypothetical protein